MAIILCSSYAIRLSTERIEYVRKLNVLVAIFVNVRVSHQLKIVKMLIMNFAIDIYDGIII